MSKNIFLAFDLGASGGRAIAGILEDGKLELKEVHRFKNQMTSIHGSYYWNIYSLFDELKKGLKKCINDFQIIPQSVAVDTWGVDYSLITGKGQLVGLPYAYRDHRTDDIMNDFFNNVLSREDTYMLTGIQFMQFNSLFQLYASVKQDYPGLRIADHLLFTPDTINYLFTGIKKNEYTIASTSQLLKPGKAEWESRLFQAAGIPEKLQGQIVQPGTILGKLLPEISEQTGCGEVLCVAVASHDTASAVVSVPAEEGNWAYISSGTWSLLGIESKVPLVSKDSLAMNFTNEGGAEETTRLMKNIMGMWLIQECKRVWDDEIELSWQDIVDLSLKAEPFKCLINPDDDSFLNPGNMPETIINYCKATGQPVPENKGEIARCIYDSLVLKYKYTINNIETITGKKIDKLHIIGGGAYNEMLNQLTADAAGIPVIAGPTEATAIGNIMMQAKALGVVNSVREIREVVRRSVDVRTYYPKPELNWEEAYKRFLDLMS
ncbi:MAG: rhamnulokinase [Bacteroidales bacterium]|jgi:rhamnulokinase|nr:rhamnulokinase [Bacteroidales bacterium]